jgi:hypothetical protein
MSRALFLATAITANMWAATTYTFTGTNYTIIVNFSSCGSGPCANYTNTMNVSGSFTVATALAANLSLQDITGQVTAYSFSDGINTYANTSANARIYSFQVSTDSTGHISNSNITLDLWQTGTAPFNTSNRLASTIVAPGSAQATNNGGCVLLGGGSSGVADSCGAFTGNSSTSTAAGGGSWSGGGAPPAPAPAPTGVPSLGEWGMIVLASLLGVVASRRLRLHDRMTPSA